MPNIAIKERRIIPGAATALTTIIKTNLSM
jgi:hypothetical protein